MLDIKMIRENPKILDDALLARVKDPLSSELLSLDKEYRAAVSKVQDILERKNQNAKILQAIKTGNGDASKEPEVVAEGVRLRESLVKCEAECEELRSKFHMMMLEIPNIPDFTCPRGKDERSNVPVRYWGSKPCFNFTPQEHHILGKQLGLMNPLLATKISGSRFSLLIGALARLERSVAQFMLDTHTSEYGYEELYLPHLVNEEAMYGTGQLPKFREDQFQTTDNLWLIPTAEVALTNLVREKILSEKDLPLRITAYTQCFRSEAGSAGKDMHGIFRQRQFSKVELVSITTPEQEINELERMTGVAENILQKLELTYRTVCLCTGDMGFSSRKTYDIEVWLAGQNKFREISSCSMCGDFQARRMGARYKDSENNVNFVCTLNGSGLAVGRTVIAIMENYQRADGTIAIPKALQKYMNAEIITKAREGFIYS
ncbi:MAG: serine--tRNA ligase [Holosporales bacterium]|jgi:seryl-tRNA synthetase|nr:serine--tRNA ligase [Holosporales bacterium]